MQLGHSSPDDAEDDEDVELVAPKTAKTVAPKTVDDGSADDFVGEVLEWIVPGNPKMGKTIVLGSIFLALLVGAWAMGTFQTRGGDIISPKAAKKMSKKKSKVAAPAYEPPPAPTYDQGAANFAETYDQYDGEYGAETPDGYYDSAPAEDQIGPDQDADDEGNGQSPTSGDDQPDDQSDDQSGTLNDQEEGGQEAGGAGQEDDKDESNQQESGQEAEQGEVIDSQYSGDTNSENEGEQSGDGDEDIGVVP